MDIAGAREYLVRRISPGEPYRGLLRFPHYLEIETVNTCNARCPMCTIAHWDRGARPMTDELFSRIASEVVEHAGEIKRVSLYRDGEPLIDPKLPGRIATLKEGGVKDVCISTNVSLLTESKSRELLEAGLDIIIMSIDSLRREVYEGIRVKLIFEEVLENALRFIELRNRIRPQTKVWMRMIRQSSNQGEWPQYRAYWSERLSANDRVFHHNIFNWGGQLSGFQPIERSYQPDLPCVALWSLMVIYCNGDVPLCNVDFNNRYPTGSVVSDSIADLWRSRIMRQRRLSHLRGHKGDMTICENCNAWDEPSDMEGISSRYANGELRAS